MGKASKAKAAKRASQISATARGGGPPKWVFPAVIAALVVVGGVLALVLTGGSEKGGTASHLAAGDVQAGDRAPDFEVPALDGSGTVALARTRGKPTLLMFWAHWCPHCQKELPLIQQLSEQGESVISVSTSPDPSRPPSPEELMREMGITFPTGKDDEDDSLGKAYGIRSFPTLFILDPSGVVKERLEGEVPVEVLKSKLDALR